MTDWVGHAHEILASGGYRVSGATDALADRLNGASGSIAVQLTW